jgi:hypothetical protein
MALQRATRRAWVGIVGRLDVAPEREDVAAMQVRDGFYFGRRRDDRAARACAMRGDGELAHDAFGIRPFGVRQRARHACHHRRRAQVDEHVPGIAQHDRLVAAHPLLARDGKRGLDRALHTRFARPSMNQSAQDPRGSS